MTPGQSSDAPIAQDEAESITTQVDVITDEAIGGMGLNVQVRKDIIEHKFGFPERPWLDRIEREGSDHRNKKNVTKTMFVDIFSPGDVVHGKWLLNDAGTVNAEGQELSNHIYDSLLDLTDAINVPAKALFLNGQMVLGVGADGKGGKDAAG